jgi:hypothetical protein
MNASSVLTETTRVEAPPQTGRFAAHFKARYLRSLDDYKFFYDDVEEIGSPDTADYVFYFVPGISGTPGQMRFMLPSLTRVFGPRVYLKALHLAEFSAHRPIWEKYTAANLEKKLQRLREDLSALLSRHARVAVLCSSNGFYDFAAAASDFPKETLAQRVQLVWGACAPDHFEPTPWETVFFPLNGFVHYGHRWFAYPNHNAFARINPETSTSLSWRDGHQRRQLFKVDLESRFKCWGFDWDYVSPSQLGAAARYMVERASTTWEFPAEALVAANDGYWQGRPRSVVENHVRRYLPHSHIEFKPTSHLWVVNPTNLTDLFGRLKLRLPPLH